MHRGGDGIAQRVHAFHAEPGALGNALQADAVCVVGCVAAIAKQQNLLVVGEVADWARCSDLVVQNFRLFEPWLGVELGDLFFVLDGVGGEQCA